MNNQTFANLLKKYINDSKLSISSLSRYSDVNRTLIQKFISGAQLPSNYEILDKILNILALSPIQKEEIKRMYKIEKIGYEKCNQFNLLDQIINEITKSNNHESLYQIQVNFQKQLNQATNREELKLVLYSLLNSIENESLDILFNVDEILYPIILQHIKQKKLNIRIILCLSYASANYSYNLLQLKRLISFLNLKEIDIHYIYLEHSINYSLYPFSISSKNQLLLINNSISHGILLNNFDFQKEYDYKFINTKKFINVFHDDMSIIKNVLYFDETYQNTNCFCGNLFLLPYIEQSLLEKHYIGDAKNKRKILNYFITFKNLFNNITTNKIHLYCQLPDIHDCYLPLGLPKSLFKSFEKKELKLAYYNLLKDAKSNSKIIFIAIKNNDFLSKDLFIQTNQNKTFVKNKIFAFNILEPSINENFKSLPFFLENYKEITYTKEESIQYLINYIDNL